MEKSKLYKDIYIDWLYQRAQFSTDKMCIEWLHSLSIEDLELIIDEVNEVIPDDVIEMAEEVMSERLLVNVVK